MARDMLETFTIEEIRNALAIIQRFVPATPQQEAIKISFIQQFIDIINWRLRRLAENNNEPEEPEDPNRNTYVP